MATQRIRAAVRKLKKQSDFRWIAALVRAQPTALVYLVGGSVRDLLLKRPTKDYDFVVRGVPRQKLAATLARLGTVDLVGRRFGVYKFKPRGDRVIYDIALPRTERSVNKRGQHRDFAIISDHRLSLAADLARRDFTINAMAIDWATGELIDPTGGAVDLKRKRIRTVGASAERFAEDYIRMLRAVRFASQLGFTIEPATIRAIRRLGPKLKRPDLPREPMALELTRAFAANPIRSLNQLHATGLDRVLLPELTAARRAPIFAALKKTGVVSITVTMAVIFHTLTPSQAVRIARRLRLSAGQPSVDVRALAWLLANSRLVLQKRSAWQRVSLERLFFTNRDPNHELMTLGEILARTYRSAQPRWQSNLRAAKHELKRMAPSGKLPRALIDGTDVLGAGVATGKAVASQLERIRELQLQKKITTRAQALRLLTTSAP